MVFDFLVINIINTIQSIPVTKYIHKALHQLVLNQLKGLVIMNMGVVYLQKHCQEGALVFNILKKTIPGYLQNKLKIFQGIFNDKILKHVLLWDKTETCGQNRVFSKLPQFWDQISSALPNKSSRTPFTIEINTLLELEYKYVQEN